MRRRIDEAGQRVGVSRLQFRYLPPVEDFLRQRMALFGELFQSARPRGPLSGLCLSATGKPELAEKNVAQLLGTAWIDGVSSDLVDLRFQSGRFLSELTGKPRQQIA